ncbi:MAG: TIGR04053 family radical SAM/SPASM domain-containing protein [Chloroflexi bacterium]|nr:TIGR04053 family radical SAM/SPASM domain-containing protein [Chloroflexota bacterium]
MNYDERPLLVYWEVTQACDLACRHCRADAVPWRHPQELSTEEGQALLDRLVGFGQPLPHLVLTGGDPLKRPDLFDLIAYARGLGFTVAVTPSGTSLLTEGIVRRMREAEVWMMALSLDGSTPERHDAVRGVSGSFDRTVRAARWAKTFGLPLQVNTLVCGETLGDLPAIYSLIAELGGAQWALFFLIQTGRGRVLREVTPEESEEVMAWVYGTAQHAPFRIRTTEAPHYRRVALQRSASEGKGGPAAQPVVQVRGAFGIRDGNGIMFVSHTGRVYPAGFLPVSAGHVRRDDPVEVYRRSPLFLALRDPARLRGKCGLCEFRYVCGGSRARAYAATGDPLESDPLCPYQSVRYSAVPALSGGA